MKEFTWIEVLIVIVLIAVLALISVPRFRELDDLLRRSIISVNTRKVQAAVDRWREAGEDGSPPEVLTGDMFPDGEVPASAAGRYRWEYDPVTGVVVNNLPE